MKKTFLALLLVLILILPISGITTGFANGEESLLPDDDYVMLDNFDGYADSVAAKNVWLSYSYGNPNTSVEIISGSDAKDGKAMKLSNTPAGTTERIDISKEITPSLSYILSGAKGVSFWLNNTSGANITFGLLFGDVLLTPGAAYYTKENGTDIYVKRNGGGNEYYPIAAAAGFKGEIVIPLSSYRSDVSKKPRMTFQFWLTKSLYHVVIDDLQLYGFTMSPLDAVPYLEVTAKPHAFVPRAVGETYTVQLTAKGYNMFDEEITAHSYVWELSKAYTGITLTEDGILTASSAAAAGSEIEISCTVKYIGSGELGIDKSFKIGLAPGDAELLSTGATKAPPKVSKNDYFK